MSLSLFGRNVWLCGCLALAAPGVVWGQSNAYLTNGVEYAIAGALAGDQVHPAVAINGSGGYLVWEDNFTDGDGFGISALQLDGGFSGVLSPFRVNSIGAGDQEHAQVSLLNDGGAAFVWQGGRQGFQRIYARFLSPGRTWVGNEVMVNTFAANEQVNPAVATLTNGNVIVVWGSYGQVSSSSLQDVYGQLLTPAGEKVGGEFLVNQFTAYNQRSAAVAALRGGGFVVVWVSEQQRFTDESGPPSVDIYGRIYNGSGAGVSDEFLINAGTNVCANPSVAASADGGFMVAWSEKDMVLQTNSWDIFARPFTSAGSAGTARRVNTFTFGDQYSPKVTAAGADFLAVWTSLGQDGSHEGVFGQFLHGDGSAWGGEFRVNTTVINAQMHPCVASDGTSRFLAVWSSYAGGPASFDLYAQRYAQYMPPLPGLNAPLVYVPFVVSNHVYQPQIGVLWQPQAGLPVDHYEVYVDGGAMPVVSLTTNVWMMTATNGLTANSTHSFQVLYATTDGRRAPRSPSASATTWSGMSYYGIPVEWMNTYWGDAWPPANTPLVPGGPTPLEIFLSGGNPLVSSTWLRTAITRSVQGFSLEWNTKPGRTYQAQSSSDLKSWVNFGLPHFAAGDVDSVYLGSSTQGYYRVLCLH